MKNIFTKGGNLSSISSVISLSLVLFVIGILSLVLINAKQYTDKIKEEGIVFSIFLNDANDNNQREELKSYLDSSGYFLDIKFIDKETAYEEVQKEMESLQTENKKILQEARAESDAMLNQSKQSGKEIIVQAKADAKVEAEKIIVKAKQSIDNEKRAAMNEIKNQVANLSVEIASKVIDKEMKKNNNHEDYINKLLEDQSKN